MITLQTHPDPLVLGLTGVAGSGKDTVADRLCSDHGFERYALAAPLRTMIEQLLIDCGLDYDHLYDRSRKEQPIAELGVSPRQMMQTLGTEWGRSLRPDFWLRCAELALGIPAAPIHDRIVITDVRFPNEAAWIAGLGGRIVRVKRDAAPIRSHESEQHVTSFAAWWELDNTGTLGFLHDQVDAMVATLERVPKKETTA